MSLRLFYDPGFAAPIGDHIMPIRKFGLVAEQVQSLPGMELANVTPVSEDDLLRVHSPAYIEAVKTGEPRDLAESQKFPWSPQLFPSVCLTNGAVRDAAVQALKTGAAGALASGFHHSCPDHGEGFCTFNGLIVALEWLKAHGLIQTAAILDMDLHYGNGTALLAATRPWIMALSLYGNDYWDNIPYRDVTERHHDDGPNHRSAAIVPTGGPDGEAMLSLLDREIDWLIAGGKPDILLYQAGADPLKYDPYSPLDLTHDDLAARDRRVFEFAREHAIPVGWVLAGGYTKDVSQVVQVHVNTAIACRDTFSL